MSVPLATYGQPAQNYTFEGEQISPDKTESPLRGRVRRAADTTIRATGTLATITALILALFAMLCKIFIG